MLCFFFSHADCFGLFDFDFDDENLPEGAENFKKVATDKRSLADVTAMVKKANNKLQELQVNLIGGWVFFFFSMGILGGSLVVIIFRLPLVCERATTSRMMKVKRISNRKQHKKKGIKNNHHDNIITMFFDR